MAQAADAAVHKVAHALVVDAHDAADVVVFALLHIVQVNNLALAWRQFVETSLDAHGEGCLVLHLLEVVFFGFYERAHVAVVDFVVAKVDGAAKLVVDAVAERGVQVTLDILHVAEQFALGEEFHEHVMYAVLNQLSVGGESRPESK